MGLSGRAWGRWSSHLHGIDYRILGGISSRPHDHHWRVREPRAGDRISSIRLVFGPTMLRGLDPRWSPAFCRCELMRGCVSRRVIKLGFRQTFVTVNMYDTVFDSPSWDCHADGGSLRTDLNDIRDTVAPRSTPRSLRCSPILDGTRAARHHARRRDRRVRPHAEAQCQRRPRPLGRGVDGARRRRRRERWAASSAAPTPRAPSRPTGPSRRRNWSRRSSMPWASPPTPPSPAPTAQPVAVYPGEPVAELF